MIDNEKISWLYDTLSQELFVYIYSFVKSREVSEDILHDAFIRLLKHSDEGRVEDTNLRAMMYTISKNLCIDHIRKKKRESVTEVDDNIESTDYDASVYLEADELMAKIDSFLQSYDPDSRAIFIMKKELDLTYAEIAERLGISERTAKRKMQKILEDLVAELRESKFLD